MLEAMHYEFMRNALMAAVLASVACGIIGVFVVTKKITFISGGIAHAAFGGIGLGYFLGINPLFCLIPFSLLSALGMGWISRKCRVSEDSSIAIFWTMSMALGVILIGLTPGYAPDLFSYLFGNILTVPVTDLWFMIVLDGIILAVTALMFKELQAVCFDEEFAEVSGLRVDALYFILLGLVALTVVILVRIVGIILVIALLTMPASIAKLLTYNLKRMMWYATLIGMGLTFSGLWISTWLDIPSGATIILVSGMVFTVTSIVHLSRRKARLSSAAD